MAVAGDVVERKGEGLVVMAPCVGVCLELVQYLVVMVVMVVMVKSKDYLMLDDEKLHRHLLG